MTIPNSNLQIILIEVEDKSGVMTRISSLFSRRGFNVKSVTVTRTGKVGISRFTIVIDADDKVMEQIRKQCQKLVHVLKTTVLNKQNSVLREFSVMKLKIGEELTSTILSLIERYSGKILEMNSDIIIVEFSGSEENIDELYKSLPAESVIETMRTGKIGMHKGIK